MTRTRIAPTPKRAPMPPDIARAVLRRAGGGCERCGLGLRKLVLHHRHPTGRGGGHTTTNVVAVCRSCRDKIHANPTAAIRDGWTVSTSPKDVSL